MTYMRSNWQRFTWVYLFLAFWSCCIHMFTYLLKINLSICPFKIFASMRSQEKAVECLKLIGNCRYSQHINSLDLGIDPNKIKVTATCAWNGCCSLCVCHTETLLTYSCSEARDPLLPSYVFFCFLHPFIHVSV